MFLAVLLAVGLLFCWGQCQAVEGPPCPPEPQWADGIEGGCPIPGPCRLEAGQVLAWTHPLGSKVDKFVVCDEYEYCMEFRKIHVQATGCYRVIWPGVHVPIPPHRYWDRGGPVVLTVQACSDVAGCSDAEDAYVLLSPWLVPLQVIE